MNAPASFRLTAPQPSRMSFAGMRGEFLKMLIKGSLLQIPTFGFYRFWLNTKIRRHLWANTQVEGEAFEYTGTAKELLIGFLIALAVLAPIYIGNFIVALMLEELRAFASLPLFFIMYVLAHFGSYRARRYRATRTIFRGIRFWMKGSGWAYTLRAVLWDLAVILTLGLALPWAMASLERYRMRHTYFGTVQGDFLGTGWTLFKRGWWIWALGLAVFIGSVTTSFMLTKVYPTHALAFGTLAFLAIFSLIFFWPLMLAVFTRWHIDGLRFGGVIVTSNLRAGSIYGLFFKVLFSSIGLIIVALLAAGLLVGLSALFLEDPLDVLKAELIAASVSIGIMTMVAVLVFFFGFGVIKRYFFTRGLWAAVVSSTSVSNLPALDAAVAAGQPSGVLGEGLADALDFNAGI
ncbi:DUF898 family protein [Microvirga sp. 2YAF29]|uniref:DUF898 family protein n=1 Tax=Microvirga sp. 2YAF29 TaxID=3233031 RepID=UPI003F9CE94D